MISIRNALIAALGLAVLFVGFLVWRGERPGAVPEGFAQGNGRIEAVEIDIASKYPGRIEAVLAHEGQLVEVGQAVVQMDTRQLRANRHQAEAELRRVEIAVENARLLIEQRQAEQRAAEAVLSQTKAAEDVARRQLARSESLAQSSVASERTLEIDRSAALGAVAAVASAEAAVAAAKAGVAGAEASVIGAEAAVAAAQAAIEAIDVEIEDSTLKAPRKGRLQYIVAREG